MPTSPAPRKLIALMLVIFASSFVAILVGRIALQRRQHAATVKEYRRLDSLRTPGRQLVLVYVGSARCSWCNDPSLPGLFATLRDSIRSAGARRGIPLKTAGVAVDVLPQEGLDYLKGLAPFDEISSGGGWLNEDAIRFIWTEYGSPAATPQILLLYRTVTQEVQGTEAHFRINQDRLLVRKVGLRNMDAWVKAGVPIPAFGSATASLAVPVTK